jgi:TolA-binding protein
VHPSNALKFYVYLLCLVGAVVWIANECNNAQRDMIRYYDTGVTQYEHGDYDGALKSFRIYIHNYPGVSSAHYRLSLVLLKKDKATEARSELKIAFDLATSGRHKNMELAQLCREKINEIDSSR